MIYERGVVVCAGQTGNPQLKSFYEESRKASCDKLLKVLSELEPIIKREPAVIAELNEEADQERVRRQEDDNMRLLMSLAERMDTNSSASIILKGVTFLLTVLMFPICFVQVLLRRIGFIDWIRNIYPGLKRIFLRVIRFIFDWCVRKPLKCLCFILKKINPSCSFIFRGVAAVYSRTCGKVDAIFDFFILPK
jgi:hypothetical protein